MTFSAVVTRDERVLVSWNGRRVVALAGADARKVIDGLEGATDEQAEQLDLLGQLNRMHLARRPGDGQLEGQIKAMETAFHMQREAMDAFDISREPEAVARHLGAGLLRKPFELDELRRVVRTRLRRDPEL